MGSANRLMAITTAVILSVVTYCAQTCFDMETAKPDCPKHHTADCCKHETPVSSSALQTITAFLSGATKFLPSIALDAAPETASVIPPTDLGFADMVSSGSPSDCRTSVLSLVLRI